MPNFLTSISPINPPKVLGAKNVQLQAPVAEEHPVFWAVEMPGSFAPTGADLPVKSVANSFPMLWPEQTSTLTTIPYVSGIECLDESNSFSPLFVQESLIVDLSPDIAFQPVYILEHTLALVTQKEKVEVSDNLLEKLLTPKTVSGMSYSDRYWKTEKIPEYGQLPRKPDGNHRRNPVRPRDLHEVSGMKVTRPSFVPSFWDMIFVLLQPPLDLGKTESLLLPHDLYPYQIEGVKFLVSNEHALLADDMGTGKTVMSTVALKLMMRANQIKKALILCPPSVLYEWKRHIAEWFPEIIACFVRGTKENRLIEWNSPAHIYVTSYDTLRSDVENGLMRNKLNDFDLVLIDEAHHLKNPRTSRSRAIRRLKPKIRWALTGTPIQNKIDDMAAIFDFLYPNYLTPYDMYEARMMIKVAPFFLRRRKKDVLKDLPPKIKQEFWLDMTTDQSKEYFRVEHDIQEEIKGLGNRVTKQHIFAKMQRLKQICNFPTNSNTSPKLDVLKEQIEEVAESGNKVIVFTQYVDYGVTKIVSSLSPYGISKIVGGQSDSSRKEEIEKFKFRDDTSVLVASVRSGGEGLNLTEASYVVHFDHWWNPAVMWQAEDRVHRRGQTHNVNIYSYWMKETIDERIHEILKKKGLLFQKIVDGLSEETIDELITMDDLFEIIGVKKSEQARPSFDPAMWRNMTSEQIHQKLFEISSVEFEDLVRQLMQYFGYPNVNVTKKTGDGGIDVISTRFTEKGTERIAAQCKRYKQPIGVGIAREFQGAIQDDKSIVKGYLVTTSDFSSDCISYCVRQGIEMINGIRIAEYVRTFGLVI